MTYLLAQKLVCPHKFILLRGNHETRTQNSFPDYRRDPRAHEWNH